MKGSEASNNPETPERPDGVIGRDWPRADARAKASGVEKYAADLYPDGLLWLGVKRSDHAHARLRAVDSSAAEALPGVVAVLTHRDVRGTNRVGVPEFDQPVLCNDKVRHRGDPVALILAEDKALLPEAAALVRVEYEALPAVTDPEEALRHEAPVLHEQHRTGNVLLGGRLRTGDGADALAACDVVAEGEFRLPCQEHAYLETECGVARVEAGGELVITASTQTPHRDLLEVANALGLPREKVRVVAPYLGGGFGGKDGITVQGLLALGALHAGGRPVKLLNSREESFLASTKRHPARIRAALGCRRDGTLHALRMRLVLDTGAYACLGGAVLELAMEHAGGIYRIPHAEVEGLSVYTNNPPSGAFRGFGVPQVTAALESLVDELAEKVGQDPVSFRLCNALRSGERTAVGALLPGADGGRACLEALRGHPRWAARRDWVAAAPPNRARGVGVAASLHGMGYGPEVPDRAGARVELLPDGRFAVYAGVSDMGQGNAPTFLQIAAEVLGQPADRLALVLPDTARTLPSGSSSASRTTFTYGNALVRAAQALKTRLLRQAAALLGAGTGQAVDEGELELRPGAVLHRSGRQVPLDRLAADLPPDRRLSTETYTAPVASETVGADPALRQWGLPHTLFSFAAHLAGVEVDRLTGETRVDHYLACTEAGGVLNPQLFEQQVQGGVAQGLGYALFEDFRCEDGRIRTPNLTTYILPAAADVPDVESVVVGGREPEGPFGMKGVGELVIDPVYAAVSNALADAVGARLREGPFTAERVLAALPDDPASPEVP